MKGYACIGLNNPRLRVNVGHVLRAAYCYNARMVAIGGTQARRCMEKAIPTDTPRAYRSIPTVIVEDLHAVIPFDCVPVAVDIIEGAESLITYQHPLRAFYVFGAENETLGRRVLSWCRDVVYVPTDVCMNLSAAVNVVLYDRMAKLSR